MDQKSLKHYEALLRAEQEKLRQPLARMTAPSPETVEGTTAIFPEFGEKEEDNASEVAAFQDNLSIERQLETKLRDVEHALAKIAQGTYGLCEECGQPIERKRLDVSPEASRCLRHASGR